ncbi:MAG TPA: VOC family protein [Chthoniobacterales bacterium]|nr:VOC family protein [Chthoniobacterales bacterium]
MKPNLKKPNLSKLMPSKITPFLWFDGQAEEAANFYLSIFPNSKITALSRYGEVGSKEHGWTPGTVMVIAFELDGQPFTALNGGPHFKFTEAISFQIDCETQEEVDHYWSKLSAVPEAEQCGWLKDKFGLSWQVVPAILPDLLGAEDSEKSGRAMQAMLGMKKMDIAALQRAFDGA